MPFMLERVLYVELTINAIAEHDNALAADMQWETEWWDTPIEDGYYYQFLRLKTGDTATNPAYSCNLVLFGVINTDNSTHNEQTAEFKGQQIAVVQQLIGCAREKVRSLTADSPWGAIIVPPIPIF